MSDSINYSMRLLQSMYDWVNDDDKLRSMGDRIAHRLGVPIELVRHVEAQRRWYLKPNSAFPTLEAYIRAINDEFKHEVERYQAEVAAGREPSWPTSGISQRPDLIEINRRFALRKSMDEWSKNEYHNNDMFAEVGSALGVDEGLILHVAAHSKWRVTPDSSFPDLDAYIKATYKSFTDAVRAYQAEVAAAAKAAKAARAADRRRAAAEDVADRPSGARTRRARITNARLFYSQF